MKNILVILLLVFSVSLAYGQKKQKIKKGKEYTSGSGLKYIFFDINKKAEKADSGDVVYVHYIGKLSDGTQFDESYSRKSPLKFQLGVGRVIKGWDEGIQLMHVGDSALLTIPPEIGYGERDMGQIPPNSTLIFTVKLVKIEKAIKPYNVAGLDTISLDSGLKYILVKKGKGKLKSKDGDRVSVNYVGYLSTGKKFDASYDRSGPLSMVLGRHQVIKGWEMGLQKMTVGEKRRLIIPYQLAYGEKGRKPTIPAKAELVFDVEMVAIAPDAIPKPYDVSGLDTTTTKTGLKYIKINKTNGDRIVNADTVYLKYVAYFEDGSILESTYERNDSLMIISGSETMIPGLIEVVNYLKVGEKARVIIPYQLGFGEEGRPPVIPAKTTLIFDLYIANVKKGKLVMPRGR
ncbi:MAG: FKBP-type peptidyl-prolyl cis-trans isomerase [Bacteroidales bacterium]|nr:FKBP-type peptidyl-prolyl cis-trans isomerase [Bacteroidales bacterium]